MPLDCHGTPLAIGDVVTIRGTLSGVFEDGSIYFVPDIPPRETKARAINFDSKMVQKEDNSIRAPGTLTEEERAFIEFHSGGNLARDGQPLHPQASAAAQAGWHMQDAIRLAELTT